MAQHDYSNEIIPHLFRREYGKMTAVLCRHFGLQHIQVAEDIVSDTFLKAAEHWAIYGVPDKPLAWLYTVAKNKARDYFKHHSIFETKIKAAIKPGEAVPEIPFEYPESGIADSQLLMIFAVCNPAIASGAQICLALRVLCGFGVAEIAHALLTNRETIKKRLQRAKATLRSDNFQITGLDAAQMNARLDPVLKTLYLLFNEGYYSRSGDRQVRKELCLEATRLVLLLAENKRTDLPEVNALLALMCFQSSRLEAREGAGGAIILFEDQNRTLWDQSLIHRGNYYLLKATAGTGISRYHLEAGIAYWHTTTGLQKWKHILELYDQLLIMAYTPVAALNRFFALAQVHGNEKAIAAVEASDLAGNEYYHMLLGHLYATADVTRAIQHYQHALTQAKSGNEKRMIEKQIAALHKR